MIKTAYFWAWAGLIAIVTLASYANHFHNSFHFDDFHTITENGSIRNLSHIPKFFIDCTTSSSIPTHQGYRPLVTTLSAINYAQGGLDTFWYHVSNFGLFAVIVICFYFFQLNFYGQGFALLGAAWFALLPANAETINYLISRSDILSTLGILGSFVWYLNAPASRKSYVYLIPAIFGMFAKETTVMFAPALVAYHFYFDPQAKNHFLNSVKKGLIPLLVCLALGAFGVAMTHHHVTGSSSRFLYFMTEPYVMLHYVVQFFFPLGLSADTDMPLVVFPTDDRIYIGFTFVASMTILIFKLAKFDRWKPASFGLSWFLLMLLPTSSFIPFSEVTNDHRLFLPALGLILAMTTVLKNYWLTSSLILKRLIFAPVILLCFGAYAYGIHERNAVWKDEKTLWTDVVAKSPLNGRAWMNYGLVYMGEGQYKIAEDAFNHAKTLTPYYSTLFVNIGIVLAATHRDEEAKQNFEKSITLNQSGELEPYYFYARFWLQRKHYPEAEVYLKEALRLFPGHLPSRQMLMETYQGAEKYVELSALVKDTLTLYPNDVITMEYLKH
jgi:hypothetical protein